LVLVALVALALLAGVSNTSMPDVPKNSAVETPINSAVHLANGHALVTARRLMLMVRLAGVISTTHGMPTRPRLMSAISSTLTRLVVATQSGVTSDRQLIYY
jgi:hypothetical protein